jgi:outer membrane protein OmpA-like peptidoglycan-associated protein
LVLNNKKMKKILTFIAAGCLLFLTNNPVLAQNAILRYSDKQLELSNIMEAAKGYQKAYEKKASYRAAKGAAVTYDMLSSYKEANKWWEKTVEFEESTADDFSNYIFSIHQAGSLDDVKIAISKASPKWQSPKDNFNMDSLMVWYAQPKNIQLASLETLNSNSADYGISHDQKGNVYFSSDRGDIASSGKKAIRVDGSNTFNSKQYGMTGRDFIGIFYRNEDDQVQQIQPVVPNTFHFSDPYLMKDKPVLFYTITRDLGKVKKKSYDIYPEVYFSTINDKAELQDYHPLPINSALEHGIINPFVDEEEKKIYFSSNLSGGFGGYDLYYITYDEEFKFGSPVNLGPAINTKGDERDPFRFGERFYFTSNGHVGFGGLDIFQAEFNQGNITEIQNMGLPYNSPQDDFAMRQTPEGKMYLSSNRQSSTGLDDLYVTEDLHRQFFGKVFDSDGNPVEEGLTVELLEKDSQLAVDTQQENKGTIQADINPDTDYQLTLSKKGYFAQSDSALSTKNLHGAKLEKEYHLKKIPYKTIASEEIIYHDLDNSDPKPEANLAMNQVAELLKTHPYLDVIIRSHTDSRASKEYNQALSERRANAVREVLGNYGVESSRIKSEWFGEEQLLNDCKDGVDCPESQHQMNRRSELILIAFPNETQAYNFPKNLEGIDLSRFEGLELPRDSQ